MKQLTDIVKTFFILLILLISLSFGGCLEQNSGSSAGKGNEKKGTIYKNESIPNLYNDVIQNEVNNSEHETDNYSVPENSSISEGLSLSENSTLTGNSTLQENSSLSENLTLPNESTLAGTSDLEAPYLNSIETSDALPQESDEVSFFGNSYNRITFSESALKTLEDNGFVVIENPYNPNEENINSLYATLKQENILIFITTDSVLHLYHIQFDETLRRIEENEFYDTLWNMDLGLLKASTDKYNTASGNEQEAARRNAAYFSVALSLLQPKPDQVQVPLEENEDPYAFIDPSLFPAGAEQQYQFEIPGFAKQDVEAELAQIEAYEGFEISPIFKYQEDYSQYVPRGHYTHSEKLKNYFKAFMWHGRMSMLLKDKLILSADPATDAHIQTIQACLISSDLQTYPELLEKWDRIYNVTAFYAGFSDDFGPYEYIKAMDSVFENGIREFNETTIVGIKSKLAEFGNPKIYGGTGNCVITLPLTPEKADQCLENTSGFRFMGQRFIPDSYIFSNMVGIYTERYMGEKDSPFTLVNSRAGPIRGFPRGLDTMALLGSKRAVYWLNELNDSSYENYSVQYNKMKFEFSNFNTADWNRNLYWSWLYSLQPLLKDYGNDYPTFMQTDAWKDKEMNTALASWTELRHDTILYAKQSYTLSLSSGIEQTTPEETTFVGYVEPVPEFYVRLLALTNMTNQGLDNMGVLDSTSKSRLTRLEEILSKLQLISEKEVGNNELSAEDYEFIKNFGDHIEDTLADVDVNSEKTTIVADVHTDPNSGNVLEEGVGHVDMLVVAYRLPDGSTINCAGPVLSHYEFKQPMQDRLTDEKWREMLETNPPQRPEWSSTYLF